MAGLTLDAGALIAVDRGDRRVISQLKRWLQDGTRITVPATAFAQAWRGPRNANLSRFSQLCAVEPFTELAARRAGELCSAAGTSDIVDASVVVSAGSRSDDILTSDVDDLSRLAPFVPRVGRILSISNV